MHWDDNYDEEAEQAMWVVGMIKPKTFFLKFFFYIAIIPFLTF